MSSLTKKAAIVLGASALLIMVGAQSSGPDLTRNTEAGGKTCFRIRDVEGYSPTKIDGRDGVNLRMSDRNVVFQLEFNGPCPEARTASRLKLKSNLVTDYICSGSDTRLHTVDEDGHTQQCAVSGLRKLTRDQISALGEEEKP